MVSHLSQENRWMVKRVKSGHSIFGKILCFKYVCRAQIGRAKPKKGLSKKEFAKVIEKNRERGFYDVAPVVRPSKKDSVVIARDTVTSEKPNAEPELSTPKSDSLITLNEFLFEVNSFKLKAEHLPELDQLSEYLLARPSLELTISGHTDNTGDETRNLNLSTQRAKSVADYLVDKGVSSKKMLYKGMGSAQPIDTNNTSEGRSRNRRVEILIRSKK